MAMSDTIQFKAAPGPGPGPTPPPIPGPFLGIGPDVVDLVGDSVGDFKFDAEDFLILQKNDYINGTKPLGGFNDFAGEWADHVHDQVDFLVLGIDFLTD